MLLAEFLTANGISPDSVRLKYFAFPAMAQELLAHKIDVAFLSEPFISIGEETTGLTALTNLDGGAAEEAFHATYGITPQIAAIMTYDSYPVGSVNDIQIQRVADDMLQLGLLKKHFNVQQMIG
jgi:ABC-type nitrate/sulfonate/bicarbonate transport system substrate-binding protein